MNEVVVKVVRGQDYSQEALTSLIDKLIAVERESLPKEWILREDADYWREVLSSPDCIAVVSFEDDKVVGILLGVPHNGLVEEVQPDDSLFAKKEESCIYVEIIQIHPSARGKKGLFSKMIDALHAEMSRNGISLFSAHVRVTTGFDKVLTRKVQSLGYAVSIRYLDSWRWAGGDRYSYMEGRWHEPRR